MVIISNTSQLTYYLNGKVKIKTDNFFFFNPLRLVICWFVSKMAFSYLKTEIKTNGQGWRSNVASQNDFKAFIINLPQLFDWKRVLSYFTRFSVCPSALEVWGLIYQRKYFKAWVGRGGGRGRSLTVKTRTF